MTETTRRRRRTYRNLRGEWVVRTTRRYNGVRPFRSASPFDWALRGLDRVRVGSAS